MRVTKETYDKVLALVATEESLKIIEAAALMYTEEVNSSCERW